MLLDEPAGPALDLVTGINGVLTNGPTRRVHIRGQEILFAKASSQYINLGNPEQLQPTGSITIATEYRLDSIPAANTLAYTLVGKDTSSGGRAYTLDVYRNTSGQGVRFYVNGGGGGGTASTVSENRSPAAGDDRQVVASMRASDRLMALYIDGRVTNTNTSADAMPSATADVRVGARQYPTFEGYFDGSIRYVLIWNRFLQPHEASQLFNPATRWSFLVPAKANTIWAPLSGGTRTQVVMVG